MTNTTQSLVERLLAAIDDEDYGDLISVAKEAADRIERMTAPIAGLETTAEERARWAAAFTEFEADLEAGSGMGDLHDAQEAFIRSVPPVAIARLLRDFDRLTAHANAETARADAASADRVKANNEWRLDYNRLAVRLKAERAEAALRAEASRDATQAAGTRALLEKDELAARVQRQMDARIEQLETALRALVDVVGSMRVPQTIADAALQITIVGPVLERARAALTKKEPTT